MRRAIGLMVLITGCASPEYRPGPPMTVSEPTYSGPVVTAPRANSNSGSMVATAPGAVQPPCEPTPGPAPRATFMDWLRSGRGWTWGRASREPVRDEGLDRLMVDTLTNSRPQVSREPLPPVQCLPGDSGIWTFPSAPTNRPEPGN